MATAAAGLCLAAFPVAATAAAASLQVTEAWMLPAPPGAPTAAAYVTIRNAGVRPDRLLGGSSPLAQKVEVHQMSMRDGMMGMQQLRDGLAIAARQDVKLMPGGIHLMLIGPKRTFVAGEHVPLLLQFAHAGTVRADVAVVSNPPVGEQSRMRPEAP